MGEPPGEEDPKEAARSRPLRSFLTQDLHEDSAEPVGQAAQSAARAQQTELAAFCECSRPPDCALPGKAGLTHDAQNCSKAVFS